jgi:DNA ligase-1
MLAYDYNKKGKSIIFPCYVQPKLDGIRGLYSNGIVFSRTGKIFNNFDHIISDIEKNFPPELILDGELYTKDFNFETLSGLVRRKYVTDEDMDMITKIKLVVYDCITKDTFDNRFKYLEKLFKKIKSKNVVLLETEVCKTENDVFRFHEKYTKKGYEGVMLRNMNGTYDPKRSINLQKLKTFHDDEFKIVDFEEGTKKEKGLIMFICETKKGGRFAVRPLGSYEERREMFENGNDYIGKMYTVRYQELTKNGIPRFGVGVGVRDYE